MGLSKEQLENMFPNRMDFSKFQVDRVRERNELTQRLMNLNGMNDNLPGMGGGRIAGERGREYVLVKNDGVDGGWALGVVSTEEKVGERNKPIDVDKLNIKKPIKEESSEDDDFEDVPIEGLNRLPKLKAADVERADAVAEQRKQLYASRRGKDVPAPKPRLPAEESLGEQDSLFVGSTHDANVHADPATCDSEEDNLNKAIAMSLQQHHAPASETEAEDDPFEDVPPPVFEQRAVEEISPFAASRGRGVAHIVNNRANAALPKRRAASISSDEDDLQTVLAAARKQKKPRVEPIANNVKNPWDGPLPFERLNPSKSIFSKKKSSPAAAEKATEASDEEAAGGFDRDDDDNAPKPLPPWLAQEGDIRSDYAAQQARDEELNAADREIAAEEERRWRKANAPVNIESSDEEGSDVEFVNEKPKPKQPIDLTKQSTQVSMVEEHVVSELQEKTADDLALQIRGNPPQDDEPDNRQPSPPKPAAQLERESVKDAEESDDEEVEWSESDYGDLETKEQDESSVPMVAQAPAQSAKIPGVARALEAAADFEEAKSLSPEFEDVPAVSHITEQAKSPSPVFEDVEMPDANAQFPSDGAGLAVASPATLRTSDSAFDRAEEQQADPYEFDEFSDPDDEEIMASMAAEAEENARFQSQFNNKTAEENQADYERELKTLRAQQKKDRRDADDVTQTMVQECKALLGFFGLPYLTAEGEAEAQCAELVHLGLVDGIVTDDCDVFLFGGTRVYKNMFNSNKFVECYLAADIEKEITLGRQQLINIAQLLGSDYTEGLPGIGPITALEIISEFPGSDGLERFRDWWKYAQAHPSEATKLPAKDFKRKFQKAQGKKLFLPPGFPSPAVKDAYLTPRVDRSTEPFQWGVADLNRLRNFLMETIGWSQERVDEVLVPVIRDMNKRATEGTQANITRYFEGGVGVGARDRVEAGRMEGTGGSKRMKDAVNRLKARRLGDPGNLQGTWGDEAREWARKNELSDEAEARKRALKAKEREEKKIEKKNRAQGKRKPTAEETPAQDEDDGDDESDEYVETSNRTKSRRGRSARTSTT